MPKRPPKGRPSSRFRERLSLALLGSAALGCAVDPSTDEEEVSDSTQAAVRVQHVQLPNGDSRSDAVAGFVRLPVTADADQVLSLMGLEVPIPAVNDCLSEASLSADLSSLSDAELLEADAVILETSEGASELAPYAFPAVADLVRGAVYLSRDRESSLPFGGTYTLLGSGISNEASSVELATSQQSPPPLAGVVIDGQELAGSLELTPRSFLDLSWNASDSPDDIVVVTVENEQDSWACSFSDQEEYGSVSLVADGGVTFGQPGQESLVTVHRIRTSEMKDALRPEGIDAARMTFDFAVQASVSFADDAGSLADGVGDDIPADSQ